ncbi:diguanylate cyclase domain-containing protein [Salinibacterium sp. GXW1014]|uniref:sensor domain-containing diguanylate cyclase n=1 Tax=Salinibacterium sp. GXW1014 TaxID=3377838 RepID=UPI00383AA28A
MSDAPAASRSNDIEASLEDLYEHAPCGFFSTTIDGVIVRVNETFVSMSGRSREQLLGAQVLSILTPGGQLFYESRYIPVLHLQGEAQEVALTLQTASGEERPVLVNGVVIDGVQGRPTAIRAAVFPYSGRKEYERELLEARRAAEASESRLQVLYGASERFSSADTEEQLASELAECARDAFTAPDASVYLADESGTLALAAGNSPLAATLLEAGGPIETSMAGECVVSVSETDADANHPASLRESMRSARVETVVVVPIAEPQKRFGALVLSFRRARRFESQDEDLGLTLARQAAEVLARLRAEAVLERLALYDDVTGLPTRRVVVARTNEAIDEAQSNSKPMAIVAVVVDGFKEISNTFGRVAAEDALSEVGGRISIAVPDADLVGRTNTNEFVVVCKGTDAASIESLVDTLGAALEQPLGAGDGSTAIASTIGAALYRGVGARPSAQSLFDSAGEAVYRAQALGTNRAAVTSVD